VSGDAASIKGNQADANGFASGISDDSGAGIVAQDYTKPPVGKNTARGNDDPAECNPPRSAEPGDDRGPASTADHG
jgi:hypothetical protein